MERKIFNVFKLRCMKCVPQIYKNDSGENCSNRESPATAAYCRRMRIRELGWLNTRALFKVCSANNQPLKAALVRAV